MTPLAGRLIICEKSGRWATAIRRELGPAGPRPQEVRSLGDATAALREAPAGLVFVEITSGNLEASVAWLVHSAAEFPPARAIAVAADTLEAAEAVLREAGAVAFVTSMRDLAGAVRLAIRHLGRWPSADRSPRERWLDRLPWSDEASSMQDRTASDRPASPTIDSDFS